MEFPIDLADIAPVFLYGLVLDDDGNGPAYPYKSVWGYSVMSRDGEAIDGRWGFCAAVVREPESEAELLRLARYIGKLACLRAATIVGVSERDSSQLVAHLVDKTGANIVAEFGKLGTAV